MSAELLRKAASEMRGRAEAATPGPWESFGDHLVWPSEKGPAANDPILAMVGDAHDDSAEHIASWHPAVALAVADLLTRVADDYDIAQYGYWSAVAEKIARAYLGEDA